LANALTIGITKRNTIVVACIVNIWLYKSAFSTRPSGSASCRRISTASRPPTTKKNSAVAPYMSPSRLWSTVNSHDLQPCRVVTGRFSAPSDADGMAGTTAGAEGRSMMAMSVFRPYFSVTR
jgi:hypothetical protein